MKVIIIGAGAAGCFCAVNLKRMLPDADITVLEAGKRALAKVAITGGGRCNLTNSFEGIKSLKEAYPRGEKLVKRAFCEFDHRDTCRWFEEAGVRLVTQPDQCVFPASQDAMQIVHTLLNGMERAGVKLKTGCRVSNISDLEADVIVVTTGGSPRVEGLSFLSPLGLEMAAPVPSLFSFNIKEIADHASDLMGVVVEEVTTGLAGTKLRANGPLLLTHWGMSGPAILKLSSYAARHLAECGYHGQLLVNWLGQAGEEEVRRQLLEMQQQNGQKLVQNARLTEIPSRLWNYIMERAGIRAQKRWAEVGSRQINRLTASLTADTYDIAGQSRHKEEFVTCGGVALSNINLSTLECKNHPGIYLAGEVLDVDAITGGFNLQAAWSMGYVVAKSISQNCQNKAENR